MSQLRCYNLLVAFLVVRSAPNWEDANCYAIAGNTSAPIDGAPEQVRVVPGRNSSSYVVHWISHLSLRNNEMLDPAKKTSNNWPVLAPSRHQDTFRKCLVKSEVQWGTTPAYDATWLRAEAAARLYTEPMCGTTRLLHNVPTFSVNNTKPLFYRVRSYDKTGSGWSEVFQFKPLPGTAVFATAASSTADRKRRLQLHRSRRINNVGGAGATATADTEPTAPHLTATFTFDMASRDSEHNNSVCSQSAVPALVRAAQSGEVDLSFHGGDTSYNLDDNCGTTGDSFFRDLKGGADRIPFIFSNGNHETGFDRTYDAYTHRFQNQWDMGLASRSGSTRWFSLDAGNVHFVVLDADAWVYWRVYGLAGAQYTWLERDLAQVNRTRTPWVVVVAHRPLYTTANANEEDAMRNGIRADVIDVPLDVYAVPDLTPAPLGMQRFWALEPLLHQHKVDLWLSGHVHRYQRSWPVLRGEVMQRNYVDPLATVHIMAGVGGCGGMGAFVGLKPRWEAYRDMEARPGYGKLTVSNATHAKWELIGIDDKRSVIDSFTIKRTQVPK